MKERVMKNRIPIFVAGIAALAMGCSPETATEPALVENAATPAELHRSRSDLVVMSQNLYVGADVDAVILALMSGDPAPALIAAAANLQETDFPTRAAGFAEVVARKRPHVIGLSEVSKIDIDLDLTPLGGPHIVYHVDFLTELKQALRNRHLHYRVAAIEKNLEAVPIPGVSLIDYDVMLVDARRVAIGRDIVARNFTNNIGLVQGTNISLVRGFVSVPIKVDGERYRVTSAHLESDLAGQNAAPLRAAQMQELLGVIGDARHAVLMGDLNDFTTSDMYQLAVAAGFTDLWAALQPGTDGFTCCHAVNLTDTRVMNQRIDYIFARGFERRHDPVDGFIRLFGALPSEMIPGPVHPIFVSDHAGLVAGLETPHHFDRHHGGDDRWDDGRDDRD
jgi:hypothetical protein